MTAYSISLKEGVTITIKNNTIIAFLPDVGVIKCAGVDARKFLQGQLTAHLDEVTFSQSRLACCCDHKGRIISTLRLLQERTTDNEALGESFLLLLPLSMVERTLSELKKFALFSKVELSDVSRDFSHVGVSGSEAKAILDDCLISIPDIVDTLHRVDLHHQRYQLFGTVIMIDSFLKKTSHQATPPNSDIWQRLDIINGIPSILPETSGLFTPHQINYPALGGVSFKKGCYRGQEIIARMEYRSKDKIKQTLYRAKVGNLERPQPGAEIFNDEDIAMGHIVNVAPDSNPKTISERSWEILAVMNRKAVENKGKLRFGSSVISVFI